MALTSVRVVSSYSVSSPDRTVSRGLGSGYAGAALTAPAMASSSVRRASRSAAGASSGVFQRRRLARHLAPGSPSSPIVRTWSRIAGV